MTDPSDYAELIEALDANGGMTSLDFRKRLAAKAVSATAAYDSMIASWFVFAYQQPPHVVIHELALRPLNQPEGFEYRA